MALFFIIKLWIYFQLLRNVCGRSIADSQWIFQDRLCRMFPKFSCAQRLCRVFNTEFVCVPFLQSFFLLCEYHQKIWLRNYGKFHESYYYPIDHLNCIHRNDNQLYKIVRWFGLILKILLIEFQLFSTFHDRSLYIAANGFEYNKPAIFCNWVKWKHEMKNFTISMNIQIEKVSCFVSCFFFLCQIHFEAIW